MKAAKAKAASLANAALTSAGGGLADVSLGMKM